MIEYKREEQVEMLQERGFLVKVIGVGGAGSNVLDQIALDGMEDAELVCMNTDVRTLKTSTAHVKIQIGKQLTRGLGGGGDPELGILAAEEAETEIRNSVRNQNMVFICAGLGGGTGSGAAPIISRIAKEEGAFVVVFATMPFSFEGRRRIEQAETALQLLERSADALITFENDRMGELVLPKEGIQQAFANADKIISQSVRAITNVVTQPGLIQIGMDDLLTALKTPVSRCLFGYGVADGKNRAQEALKMALRSPLLDRGQLLEKTRNSVVHVVGGNSMSLYEVELLMNDMSKYVGPDTQILFGAAVDEKMDDSLSVTIISSLTLDELREHQTATSEREEATVKGGEPEARRTRPASDNESPKREKENDESSRQSVFTRASVEPAEEMSSSSAERDQEDVGGAVEVEVEDEAEVTSFDNDEPPSEAPAARRRSDQDQSEREHEIRDRDRERELEEERKRQEAFERRREELRRAEQPRAAAAEDARVPQAEAEVAPSRESNAEDLLAQRKRAQEELAKKRAELEKLLALEDEAAARRVEADRRAHAMNPETSPAPEPVREFAEDDNGGREAEKRDLEQTQTFAPTPRQLEPPASPAVSGPPAAKPVPRVPRDPPQEFRPGPAASPVREKVAAAGGHQGELELEPLRGRFEKSAPTVVDGENLDVPTIFRKRGKKG